jgi:hypothetical protein
VQAQFILTNTPPSVPLTVTVSLIGWSFLDKSLDDLSDEEARRRLKVMGFDVPDVSMLVDQTK